MLTYREKDNLIFKLHPFTQIAFISIVFILSLIFSHPLYLSGLLLAVWAVIAGAGNMEEWKAYLKFSVVMVVVIVVINTLFTKNGTTIIYQGGEFAGLGPLVITLEALAFGLGMSVRLLVIMSIFCLYTYTVNPDKAMGLFGRMGGKSMLAITLSVRLFPLMMKDINRITEVQRCRGVKLETGRWWERARNYIPIISIMLLSCMERSLQLAESMYARGYGSGSRTYYHKDFWRPRDYLVLILTSIGLTAGIGSAVLGWSAFSYYPVLEEIEPVEMIGAGIIVLALIFPATLNWGWLKWPILKSKI